MESFEFLGGRYNRPEQIMSGPMQAFRAQNAATGRNVFIHRVSTTEAPEEQAALLKLLTTALVKSSEAKRLVLDFGEERGYWYVVTESEPQCALLREWLKMQIEQAGGSAKQATPSGAKIPSPPPAVRQPDNPGEFTRFISARPISKYPSQSPSIHQSVPLPQPPPAAVPPVQPLPPAAQNQEPKVGEFTRVFQSSEDKPLGAPPAAPPLPAPPPPPAAAQSPGEFTNFFSQPPGEQKLASQFPSGSPQRPSSAPPPPPPANPAGPELSRPGEFTSFFKGGLPPSPLKPMPPVAQTGNFSDPMPSRPFVQRPNTPVPPPLAGEAPKPVENGEFTKIFSRPTNSNPSAVNPPRPPAPSYRPPASGGTEMFGFGRDAGQQDDRSEGLFNNNIDLPGSSSPSSQPRGEFTQMFGPGGVTPTPIQPQGVVAPPHSKSPVDDAPRGADSLLTQRLPGVKPQAPAPPANQDDGAPGEYTRIMQGGGGPPKATTPPSGAPGAPKAGAGASPLSINLAPVNPAAALPHLGAMSGSAGGAHAHAGASGASASSALGTARVNAPKIPSPKAVPPVNLQFGAPKAANKKMVIFFGVLGVLAVLMVLLFLFVMKQQH